MLGNRGIPEAWSRLCVCQASFLMTFAMGGVPHTGPRQQTLVVKVMSLLLNIPSRLVITFLPRSKRLLISWLQSLSAVILEPQKIKSDTVSTVFPSISHEVMGPDTMILVFWMLSFNSNIIHNSQQLWTLQMSTNREMDKQIVICTYKGLLFSHKKERNSDHLDALWKH